MGAVISGAKQMGVGDRQNGSWGVPRAIQLYESVRNLFEYPSQKPACRNDQISWKTVYNLYMKSHPKTKNNRQGRRRRD